MTSSELTDLTLHLADNALILGHRNSEWTGHGPILEQDIALSNIALDLIGQARHLYQYAAELMGEGQTEDRLAFLRNADEFKNVLLVEQTNGHWGKTILRQFLFSAYQHPFYEQLMKAGHAQLSPIAEKSLKEVTYHLRWSSEWVIRLGEGTEESAGRMQSAIRELWPYTGELLNGRASYRAVRIDATAIRGEWEQRVHRVLDNAAITVPEKTQMYETTGHTADLDELLNEMQYMQRTYPNMEW